MENHNMALGAQVNDCLRKLHDAKVIKHPYTPGMRVHVCGCVYIVTHQTKKGVWWGACIGRGGKKDGETIVQEPMMTQPIPVPFRPVYVDKGTSAALLDKLNEGLQRETYPTQRDGFPGWGLETGSFLWRPEEVVQGQCELVARALLHFTPIILEKLNAVEDR